MDFNVEYAKDLLNRNVISAGIGGVIGAIVGVAKRTHELYIEDTALYTNYVKPSVTTVAGFTIGATTGSGIIAATFGDESFWYYASDNLGLVAGVMFGFRSGEGLVDLVVEKVRNVRKK